MSNGKFLFIIIVVVGIFALLTADYNNWANSNDLSSDFNCIDVVDPTTGLTTLDCPTGIPEWLSAIFIVPSGIVGLLVAWSLGKPL